MARKPVATKVADTKAKPTAAEVKPVADEISELCMKFKALTLEERDVEEQQKLRRAELEKISGRLVELVQMSDLQPPFNTDGGGRISIRHDLSVKQEDSDKLWHSLTALGLEALIKPQVNSNSLRSLVKERMEKHEPLPDGIIVTPYAKAVFTAS